MSMKWVDKIQNPRRQNLNRVWKIVVQNKIIKTKIFESCFPCPLIRETNSLKFFNSGG